MNVCRLCGEERSSLDFNVELSDLNASDWSYKELIEYHTRILLEPNKLLPQGVCEDCRQLVDSFQEFSRKLQKIQTRFEVNHFEHDLLDTENITESFPVLELIPKTIIKEQDDDESGSDDDHINKVRRLDSIRFLLKKILTFRLISKVTTAASMNCSPKS